MLTADKSVAPVMTEDFFNIPDEPGKPGTPEITDWDKDRVDLKWTAPKSESDPIHKVLRGCTFSARL